MNYSPVKNCATAEIVNPVSAYTKRNNDARCICIDKLAMELLYPFLLFDCSGKFILCNEFSFSFLNRLHFAYKGF